MWKKIAFCFLALLCLSEILSFSQENGSDNKTYNDLLNAASQALSQNDSASAIHILEDMLVRWPDDLTVIEDLGITYINIPSDRPEFRQSLKYLETSVSRYSQNSIVYYNLSCVYSALGRNNDAVQALQKAIDLGYTDLEYIKTDTDMENLRKSDWWKHVESHASEIQNLLQSVPRDTDAASSMTPDEKIEQCKSIQDRLVVFVDKESCFTTNLLTVLCGAYADKEDYQSSIACLEEELKIEVSLVNETNPVVVSIYYALGSLYGHVDLDKSLALYQKALDLAKTVYGAESVEVADFYGSLYEAYLQKESYREAVSVCEKELALRIKLSGANSPEVETCYWNIGYALYKGNDNAGAIASHEKALAIREKVFGLESKEVADSYNELGSLSINTADEGKAIDYYKRAIAILEHLYGPVSKEVSDSCYNTGNRFYNADDYDNAAAYHQRALAIREKIYGSDSAEVAASCTELGKTYYQKKDYDNAIAYHQCALAILEKESGSESAEVAGSCNELGCSYYNKENYDNALVYHQRALAIREKIYGPDSADVASSCTVLGNSYAKKNENEKAITFFERALHINSILYGSESVQAADVLVSLAQAQFLMGDCKSALYELNQVITVYSREKGNDSPLVASYYISTGDIYRAYGDYDKAISYYKTGLNILDRNSSTGLSDLARGNERLAMLFSEKGDYDQAIVYYEKAIAVYLRMYDPPLTAIGLTYDDLGNVYRLVRKYTTAEEYYLKTLTLLEKDMEKTDDLSKLVVFNAYMGLANVYGSSGDRASVLSFLEKVKCIKFKMDSLNVMQTMAIAVTYYLNGDYEASIKNLDILLHSPLVLASARSQAQFLSMSGEVYLAKGSMDLSMEYYRKAFRLWDTSRNYQEVIDFVWPTSKYFLQSNTNFALEAVSCGISAVERARLDLGSAKTGIMAKALPLYYAAVDLSARRGNPEKSFEYSESLRSRGFLDQMGTETALRLDGVTEEERTKIHGLVTNIDSCRTELERLNGISNDKRDPAAITKVGDSLAASEKELASLDAVIGDRVPKYAQLRNPQPVDPSLAKAWCGRNRVVLEYVLWDPALETALSIKQQTDAPFSATAIPAADNQTKLNSYCLVLSSTGIEAVKLDGDYDYTSAVNKLRGAILRKWGDEKIEPIRDELYAKLIEPIAGKIPDGTKEIVVVPDGPIAYIPMDILRKDSSSPDFGSEYSIALSPSISVSVLLSAGNKVKSEKSLALGGGWYNPDKSISERGGEKRGYTRAGDTTSVTFDSLDEARGLNPVQLDCAKKEAKDQGAGAYFSARNFRWNDLPGTAMEIDNLRTQVFAKNLLTILKGRDASEASLKRLSSCGELKGFSVVHLACHGYFDSMVPDMSSVVLSEVSGLLTNDPEDGYLTVPEVALLDLNARMVSLSACETGLAQVKRGDGMVGLARSFLVAGSQNVGVSLWCVDDAATTEFMTRLYTKVVKEGLTYSEAYTAVKNEFRKSPKWSHPYYWAAFTLYK
jgi:CHAT domain-containing protein/tetratricopeptide (TPR) repeat protein